MSARSLSTGRLDDGGGLPVEPLESVEMRGGLGREAGAREIRRGRAAAHSGGEVERLLVLGPGAPSPGDPEDVGDEVRRRGLRELGVDVRVPRVGQRPPVVDVEVDVVLVVVVVLRLEALGAVLRRVRAPAPLRGFHHDEHLFRPRQPPLPGSRPRFRFRISRFPVQDIADSV